MFRCLWIPAARWRSRGSSGAGKTTLLRSIAGLLQPDQGTVAIDGAVLRGRDHAVELRVVLVPQDNGLAAILTADENVQVVPNANERTPVDARRDAAVWLDRLGLSGQCDQLVEELSGAAAALTSPPASSTRPLATTSLRRWRRSTRSETPPSSSPTISRSGPDLGES